VADKDQMRRDERDAEQRERELRKQDREMAKADEEARVQRELEHGSDPYAAEGVQTFYSDVKTPKPEEVEPEDVAPEGDDGGYNAARAKQREYLSRRHGRHARRPGRVSRDRQRPGRQGHRPQRGVPDRSPGGQGIALDW
jgi:hypothetical protein